MSETEYVDFDTPVNEQIDEAPKTPTKTQADIKKAYNKTYYEKHKTKILSTIKEKKLCTNCGKMISASNFSKHVKNNSCLSLKDVQDKKEFKKKQKIKELNEYIIRMNEMYDTDVPLIKV